MLILLAGTFMVLQATGQIKTTITGLNKQQGQVDQIKNWRSLNKDKIRDLKKEQKRLRQAARTLESNLGYDKYLRKYRKVKKSKDDYQVLSDSLRSFSVKDLGDSTVLKEIESKFGKRLTVPKEIEKSQQKAAIYTKQFESYHNQLSDKQQLKDSLSQTLEDMAKSKVKVPLHSDDLIGDYEQRLTDMEDRAKEIDEKSLAMYEDAQNREKLMGRAEILGEKAFR